MNISKNLKLHHIWERTWNTLSITVWVTSLRVITSSFIHLPVDFICLFLSSWMILHCVYEPHCHYSFIINGHLGSFCCFCEWSNNEHGRTGFCSMSQTETFGRNLTRSCAKSIPSLLRNASVELHCGSSLLSHQHGVTISLSHIHLHFWSFQNHFNLHFSNS